MTHFACPFPRLLCYDLSYIALLCASSHNKADTKNYGAILRHFTVDETLGFSDKKQQNRNDFDDLENKQSAKK